MTKSQRKAAEGITTSLQEHLEARDWLVFREMPLGSLSLEGRTPRADILAFKKSYTRPQVSIYEVKVSRQDLARDIDNAKYEKSLAFCQRFFYATPAGLAHPADMPRNVGLFVLGEKGWRTLKAPQYSGRFRWDEQMLLACLFRGYEAYRGRGDRLARLRLMELHKPVTRRRAREFGEKLGILLSRKPADVLAAERLKEKLDDYLGRETRSLYDAIRAVQDHMGRLMALEHVGLALDLVELADNLLHDRRLLVSAKTERVMSALDVMREAM